MAKKPLKRLEWQEVSYNAGQWALLGGYRRKALTVMEVLNKAFIASIAHGSIARGDVTEKSDVDVFVLVPASSFRIEVALEEATIHVARRSVVQATPIYAMKAYLELGNHVSVSFPLMKMRRVEREFYRFGGEITIEGLIKNVCVSGVDKRLMLIEPTEQGHRESSIIGHEEHVAKLLGVSIETVSDRVHALLRRDRIGRTGVFVEGELDDDETFEMALNRIADQNPAVRRRLRSIS